VSDGDDRRGAGATGETGGLSPAEGVYALAVQAARGISPLLAFGQGKLARGIRGRRGAGARLAGLARERLDPRRPTVWFHAPSVGEGLQARAVMEALKEARPGIQLLYTHFSPSAETLAQRLPAEVAGYLPWDTPGEMVQVLEAAAPAAVVFTKTEVWPVLSREAAARGIPTALIAATLPPGAGRLRGAARPFLSGSFGRLVRVGAISRADAHRFRLLGVAPKRMEVTGDPGIDSAAERAQAADPAAPWLRPLLLAARPTLVAGSSWPPDEAVLVPALSEVRSHVPGLLAVVAPHEPDPRHLAGLEAALAEAGLPHQRLAAVEGEGAVPPEVAVVVVDRVGVLAHLYTAGSAAFVGGGFHGKGLHSVLEPAAAGLPVAFGPRHLNARAAGDLLECGGGVEVADPPELASVLRRWLGADAEGGSVGRRASAYIQEHRGASQRSVRLLEALLADPSSTGGAR